MAPAEEERKKDRRRRLATAARPFDGSSLVPLDSGAGGGLDAFDAYPWQWMLRGIIIGAVHAVGIRRVIDVIVSSVEEAGHQLRAGDTTETEDEFLPDPEVEDLREFRDKKNPFHRRYFVDHRNVDKEHIPPTRSVINGIKADFMPDVRFDNPRAVFILGGSGTGKSGATKLALRWFGLNRGEFTYINTDDVMEALPGYQGLRAGLGSVNGVPLVDHDAGDEYHADAKAITKEIFGDAVEDGRDIMFDGTGRNQVSLLRRIQTVNDAGYQVSIVHTSLDPEEAFRRSSGGLPRRNYRTVPEHVHHETNPGVGVDAIVDHLGEEIIDAVDNLVVVDTSVRRRRVWVVEGSLDSAEERRRLYD